MKLETLCLHGGRNPTPPPSPARVPVYRTSSPTCSSNTEHAANLFALKELGNIYTRLMNPTTDVLEKRVALLEGAPEWAASASPPAPARSSTRHQPGQAGDNIVSARNLYGGTYTQFNDILPALGITVKLRRFHQDPENFAKAIDAKTRAVFCETVSNPALEVTDLEAIAKIAHAHGLPLIVDSTFSTPYLTRPLEHGADIVVHSLTKWFGGHGTGIGGVVVDSGKFNWAAGKHPLFDEPDTSATTACAGATTCPRRWPRWPTSCACAPCRCATSAPAFRRTTRGCSCRASRPCRCAWSATARTPSPSPAPPRPPGVEWVRFPGLQGRPAEYAEPEIPQAARAARWSSSASRAARRRREVHRQPQAVLAPRQRRRRQEPRHPPATTTHSQLNEEQQRAGGHHRRTSCASPSASNTSTTSSPTSTRPCRNPATGRPYGRAFPTVMFGDIVDAQVRLLDHLGIQRLHAVAGGSLGGLCANNFAVRYPERVDVVISIAAGVEVTIQQRITNYEQICAIEEDKHFNGGHYYGRQHPDRGLALARMISHKTFVSLDMMADRARREVVRPEEDRDKWYWLSHPVESYLRNQGFKFVRRFDANTYLRIIDAWQRFDLLADTGKTSLEEVFAACRRQRHLVFTIKGDACFAPEQQDQQCRALRKARVPHQHMTVHSDKGHDSFLLEPELYTPHIAYFLRQG
jgi:O-acetylhomoserine (thiol)-lyase